DRRTVADTSRPEGLDGLFTADSVVISAVGKSVSPFDRSKPGFQDVDFRVNMNILEAAKKAGIRKFVYVSAFHAEKYPKLAYFRAHQQFSEKLMASGIDYAIIKPPALFSAFIELIDLAKSGMLVNLGQG